MRIASFPTFHLYSKAKIRQFRCASPYYIQKSARHHTHLSANAVQLSKNVFRLSHSSERGTEFLSQCSDWSLKKTHVNTNVRCDPCPDRWPQFRPQWAPNNVSTPFLVLSPDMHGSSRLAYSWPRGFQHQLYHKNRGELEHRSTSIVSLLPCCHSVLVKLRDDLRSSKPPEYNLFCSFDG